MSHPSKNKQKNGSKNWKAKDFLPNINCMQAAERVEKCLFVPSDLDL